MERREVDVFACWMVSCFLYYAFDDAEVSFFVRTYRATVETNSSRLTGYEQEQIKDVNPFDCLKKKLGIAMRKPRHTCTLHRRFANN
jgi:hypothetical protein